VRPAEVDARGVVSGHLGTGVQLPGLAPVAQPSAAPALQAACVQPTADRRGQLLKDGGAYVRCGKPATWSCHNCRDPLCHACAHDRRWNHYPKKAAA
jgi:hypothetical protein